MSQYTEQADQFAAKHNLTMAATYKGHYPRLGDTATAQFSITLTRGGKSYTFDFSDSINSSWSFRVHATTAHKPSPGLPARLMPKYYPKTGQRQTVGTYTLIPVTPKISLYDVLSGLTKCDPGTFSDFCDSFGYDTDSVKARNLYFAVQAEYKNVERLFADCLDELQEIN